MKILIVGNGFDLAHGLPTAYRHFMGVIRAVREIVNIDTKEYLTYTELFATLAADEYSGPQKTDSRLRWNQS